MRTQARVSVSLLFSAVPWSRNGSRNEVVSLMALWYLGTMVTIKRVQTGLRIEQSLLKVLKGLAEYLDISLGELFEGMALHNFEGTAPFSQETLRAVARLREVYNLRLTAEDSHLLAEVPSR
jgi:hypothetical protein